MELTAGKILGAYQLGLLTHDEARIKLGWAPAAAIKEENE
jgi:hypothetical protein